MIPGKKLIQRDDTSFSKESWYSLFFNVIR